MNGQLRGLRVQQLLIELTYKVLGVFQGLLLDQELEKFLLLVQVASETRVILRLQPYHSETDVAFAGGSALISLVFAKLG